MGVPMSVAFVLLTAGSVASTASRAVGGASEQQAASAADPTLEAPFLDGIDQVVRRSAEMEWGPCPPGALVVEGCAMSVLEGDPRAEQIFTLRIRTARPFVLPPHTHPRNERVTVIEGAVHVGFGDRVDKAASDRYEAGDYYVNRAGAAHFVWSDEPVVLQLTGIGPWAIEPLAAADAR